MTNDAISNNHRRNSAGSSNGSVSIPPSSRNHSYESSINNSLTIYIVCLFIICYIYTFIFHLILKCLEE